MAPQDTLPLRVFTSENWARQALSEPLELLCDHAHLEKKAAANALALLHRWPEGQPSSKWTKELSEIARDESQHLALVLRMLEERKGALSKMHRNDYTTDLRKHMRSGEGQNELLDKLLVSALIEARSCERFYLLSEVAEDLALKKLYRGLWSSEQGHFETFLSLAEEFLPADAVLQRWEWYLEREAEIIQSQSSGPRIHSWI